MTGKKPAATKLRTKVAKEAGRRRRTAKVRAMSPEAARAAADAGELMDADAPVRRCFVRSDAAGWPALAAAKRTPLSQMIAGGQGGEVRLKLYLTLLWLGARTPWAVDDRPASAWARLFGLPEPDTNGAQRIGAAVDWLTKHRYIKAERSRGRPAKLAPLHERSKLAYSRPAGAAVPDKDLYFQLPQELWSEGWMGVLSGAALAALVILWDESWGRPGIKTKTRVGHHDREFERVILLPERWLAESQLKDRYRVSYDLWEKGLRELVAHGIVRQRYVSDVAGFSSKHKRRRLQVVLPNLRAGPPSPKGADHEK